MAANTLDNLDSPGFTDEVIPFQFRKDKTEEGTHNWLKAWFEFEYDKAFPRYTMYRRYLNMYKNLDEYEGDGMVKTSNRDRAVSARKAKVRDNIVYSYTEQRVSQVSRKKVSIAYVPRVQNSQEDINATKSAKLLVKARYEAMDFDGLMIRGDRTTFLTGHAHFETCWDPEAGDIAPSFARAKEKFKDGIPVIDEATGLPTAGKKLDRPLRVGDSNTRLWQPWEFFPEPGKYKLRELDYCETFEWMNKELVEHKWKKAAGKITSSEYVKWDFSTDKIERPNNQIMVRTFWHRPTEYFPEGCKITWCDDLILESIDFPYTDGELPFDDDKDIEVENEYWGRPFVTNIEQLYKINNSLVSGMARNHGVLSAPKVMFPEGSVDVKSLNNEYSALQYRGAIKPEILQHQYVNRGEIEFQKYLQSRAGELSSVYDISRGIVPPGVTAASAIRYLDEQELQRANPSIAKRNRRILNITRRNISRMSQYYKDSDERTIRLVGENNEFIIKSFKKLSLGLIADIKLENTSAIADTKTGAIADIIDLNASNQKDPLFTRKEIIKLLDLGLDEAFKEETSYASDTARTMLEAITEGQQVPPPQKTDGLLEFYAVFGRYVESLTYKTKLEPGIKQAVDDYILGLEMLMWQKSVENMKFGMALAQFEKFPMFFSPPAPPTPPMAPPAEGGGSSMNMDTSKLEFQKQGIEQQIENQGESNA